MPETPTHAVEDYVKAVYALQVRLDGPVPTNALAERLGLTPGSVSGMLRRLHELGLAEHERYRGVRLTEAGRRLALATLRRHRLLELFLVEVLDVPWERVHAEAELLEHALSDDLCERIDARLGYPAFDPHGDPIPTSNGEVVEPVVQGLDDVAVGTRVRFARVSDEDPEMLRYLAEHGIVPGVELNILDRQPFGGPTRVSIVGCERAVEHALGTQLVAAMRVAVESTA